MIMVEDGVTKQCDTLMNLVHFDHEYSIRNGTTSGIVSIPTVQELGDIIILEQTGSKNNEDIVSESLVDGDIVNEIKKINDKLQCKENLDLEGASDMEESKHIKTRVKTNLSVYNVSRPKDVLISSAIVNYGSTSNEVTSFNILKQETKTKVHSMEEFRLRNNEESQGDFTYESQQYAEKSETSDNANKKERADAVSVPPTRQNIDKDEMETEKKTKVYLSMSRRIMINMIHILN